MSEPVLVILDGLQAGSEVRLPHGESRVGNGTDCTVVVADPAMQPNHFEIIVGSSTAIRVLRPLSLLDGSVLDVGTELVVSGLTSFTAGMTNFCLQAPERPTIAGNPVARNVAPKRSGSRRFMLPVAGAIAVMTGCVALFVSVGTPTRHTGATTVSTSKLPLRQGNAAAAAAALRQRLDRSGLGTLAITAQPDGTVTAAGMLMPGDQASWDSARQWYDGRFGSDNVLVEQLSPSGSLPPLRIAAVWTGVGPYVVDDHDDRLRPGAGLEGGWFIERIDADHVFVRRGTQIVALRY